MYWNNCKEDGFPKDGSKVLVYTEDEDFCLVYYFDEIGFVEKRRTLSKILHRHGSTPIVEDVVFWKELVVPFVDSDDEDDLESISFEEDK